MSQAQAIQRWKAKYLPPASSFEQTESGQLKNQQRHQLNWWVAGKYAGMGLDPLPEKTSPLYMQTREERMKHLQILLKADYPGKASDQDWAIALANAVR